MNKYLKYLFILLLITSSIVYSGFVREDWNPHGEVHHDHSDVYHSHSHAEPIELPERLLFPSREPDRVILNLTENPESSLAVNWRTDQTVSSGFVEYAVATAGPEFTTLKTRVEAKKQALTTKHLEEPTVSAHYFSAVISNLMPAQKYVYRVGTDGAWSEWYQVQMPDINSGKLSFLYFGDAQNDLKSIWSRDIREESKTTPNSEAKYT